MAPLEGRNLRKTYRLGRRNTVEALRGVDITIEAGEMVAIMGPSGSGKSTLMHILGLLHGPDHDGGPAPELRFEGRDMVGLKDGERTRMRARQMGFVFQDFNLVPTLTALENVVLAADYAGVSGSRAKTAGLDALGLVGLADRAAHRPRSSPAGSSSGSRWPVRSSTGPRLVLGRRADRQPRLGAHRRGPRPPARVQPERRARRSSSSPTMPRSGAACDRIIRMRDGKVREAAPMVAPSLPDGLFPEIPKPSWLPSETTQEDGRLDCRPGGFSGSASIRADAVLVLREVAPDHRQVETGEDRGPRFARQEECEAALDERLGGLLRPGRGGSGRHRRPSPGSGSPRCRHAP